MEKLIGVEPESQKDCTLAQNALTALVDKENKVETAYLQAQETKKALDLRQAEANRKLLEL